MIVLNVTDFFICSKFNLEAELFKTLLLNLDIFEETDLAGKRRTSIIIEETHRNYT